MYNVYIVIVTQCNLFSSRVKFVILAWFSFFCVFACSVFCSCCFVLGLFLLVACCWQQQRTPAGSQTSAAAPPRPDDPEVSAMARN